MESHFGGRKLKVRDNIGNVGSSLMASLGELGFATQESFSGKTSRKLKKFSDLFKNSLELSFRENFNCCFMKVYDFQANNNFLHFHYRFLRISNFYC